MQYPIVFNGFIPFETQFVLTGEFVYSLNLYIGACDPRATGSTNQK